MIMGVDKYETKVKNYVPGTLVDIAIMQKWLSDKNICNYKNINVLRKDEKGYINARAVRQWLSDAIVTINASWYRKYNQGKPPFDGLILYISSHAGYDESYFLNLFFWMYVGFLYNFFYSQTAP